MSGPRAAKREIPGHPAAMIVTASLAMACAGCGSGEPDPEDPGRRTIALRSAAFAEGAAIPREHTCDGAGGSPPLEWSGVPAAAKTLVLICDDPDAPMGTFTHWVVVNLPPTVKSLTAGMPAESAIPAESMGGEAAGPSSDVVPRQGKNDFGKVGYGGPCPPSGTHRYIFRIYALDSPITNVEESPSRGDVIKAIKGHILAEGRLTGTYTRLK